MGPHDDQVTLGFSSQPQDLPSRVPLDQAVFDRDLRVLDNDLLEPLPQPFLVVFGFRRKYPFAVDNYRWRRDVQHDEPGVVVPGQVAGQLESVTRIFREVGRVKNSPDRQHGMLLWLSVRPGPSWSWQVLQGPAG